MKYSTLTLSLLLLLTWIGCSKDTEKINLETVYPNSYYPAYPSSYWEYERTSGSSFTVSVIPGYMENSYQIEFPYDNVSETKLVPVTYNQKIIYGYSIVNNYISLYNRYGLIKFMSETLDDYWSVPPNSQFTSTMQRVTSVDTSIVINNITYAPTIIVDELQGPPSNPDLFHAKRFYYTKDIGLVKYEDFADEEKSYVVLDYYIAE